MNHIEVPQTEKKQYQKPELVTLGGIEQLTKQAGASNSDVRTGTPNTAFPSL